jgi:hypothetical protein
MRSGQGPSERAGAVVPPLSALQDYGAPKFEAVHNPKCRRDVGLAKSGAHPLPKTDQTRQTDPIELVLPPFARVRI